jgi:Bacterial hydrolase
MTASESPEEVCCPDVDMERWDAKTHIWKDKLFVQDSVMQFMHIPLNMGRVVTRMMKKVEEAGAATELDDFLMLAYDPSPWKSEIHINVTKNVPGGKMIKLSGTFFSKVCDGPYNAAPKFVEEVEAILKGEGKESKRYYFYYASCPKCSKLKGVNPCIVFAQLE